MKVLIAGELPSEIADGLEVFGLDVVTRPDVTTDSLPDAIGETDILVVGDMGVSRRALERAERLLLIVRAGEGLERVDVGVASERAV
ncbi:MAG: hypothetical protein VX938_10960, partial [Myxococcota bacterium]|nr:hypothetical protein [Myxococcota bacterium]